MQAGRDHVAHNNWSLLASAQTSGYRRVVGPRPSGEQCIHKWIAYQLPLYLDNPTFKTQSF